MAFTYTKGKYLGDAEYYLDQALFFYYNQNPNYLVRKAADYAGSVDSSHYPRYKPCSQPDNHHRKIGCYDKCPSYFYRVCDKIFGSGDDDKLNCIGPCCEHQATNININTRKNKKCNCKK